jgi:hypothetical protein
VFLIFLNFKNKVHELVLKMCDSNMHGDRIKIKKGRYLFLTITKIIIFTTKCFSGCKILVEVHVYDDRRSWLKEVAVTNEYI